MRKERMLFFVGIWVAVLPFLGFPNSWRKILFVLSGLAIIYLAYLFRGQQKAHILEIRKSSDEQVMDAFVDNINNK